jgi:hypothetical protein
LIPDENRLPLRQRKPVFRNTAKRLRSPKRLLHANSEQNAIPGKQLTADGFLAGLGPVTHVGGYTGGGRLVRGRNLFTVVPDGQAPMPQLSASDGDGWRRAASASIKFRLVALCLAVFRKKSVDADPLACFRGVATDGIPVFRDESSHAGSEHQEDHRRTG